MKVLKGVVVSTKMEKTATVEVARVIIHPVYKKRYRVTKKYHVHDETGAAVGDKVSFIASKPFSKLKKWKILENRKKKLASVSKKTKK